MFSLVQQEKEMCVDSVMSEIILRDCGKSQGGATGLLGQGKAKTEIKCPGVW